MIICTENHRKSLKLEILIHLILCHATVYLSEKGARCPPINRSLVSLWGKVSLASFCCLSFCTYSRSATNRSLCPNLQQIFVLMKDLWRKFNQTYPRILDVDIGSIYNYVAFVRRYEYTCIGILYHTVIFVACIVIKNKIRSTYLSNPGRSGSLYCNKKRRILSLSYSHKSQLHTFLQFVDCILSIHMI